MTYTVFRYYSIVDFETDQIYTFLMSFLYSKIFKHGDSTKLRLIYIYIYDNYHVKIHATKNYAKRSYL
jgi:hypothetical protein